MMHLPAVEQLPVEAVVGSSVGARPRFPRKAVMLPGLHAQLPRHLFLP